MKLLTVPSKKVVNKYVSSRELEKYFGNDSFEALVVTLRQGWREDFFSFDITLDSEYIAWGEAKHKAQFPVDFLGVDLGYAPRLPRYKFENLSSKIKNGEPLSDDEVQKVIGELPHDIAEKYLRFRLRNINYEELRKVVEPKASYNDYDKVEYNGLAVQGTLVSYLDQTIPMSRKHREVVRFFVKNPDRLVFKDEFMEEPDIINVAKLPRPYETLSKLIPAVHKELRPFIGECVFNEPEEGWRLTIE